MLVKASPVAPDTFCLIEQPAVLLSLVKVVEVTIVVAFVVAVILCVPLLASLIAPVTWTKSPTITEPNIEVPDVMCLDLFLRLGHLVEMN